MVKACDSSILLLESLLPGNCKWLVFLYLPCIQTVTAKVQRSQSSVLANIYLEDTQVFHGPVSDMINFILSQATQSQAVSQRWSYCPIPFKEKRELKIQYELNDLRARKFLLNKMSHITSMKYNLSLRIRDAFMEISMWKTFIASGNSMET